MDAVPVYPTLSNSTPIKQGIVVGNHIPFGSQQHNFSSLPFTPTKGRLLGFGYTGRGMTDSLIVNTPGQESMNLSHSSSGKEEDQGHRDINSNSSLLESYDKDIRVLGGGDMSPPGGHSQGQGQSLVRQNVRGESRCKPFWCMTLWSHNLHYAHTCLRLCKYLHVQ